LPWILKMLTWNCSLDISDHRYFQPFWQKTLMFLVKSCQSWFPIHFSSFFAKNYAQDEIFELQHAKVSDAVSLFHTHDLFDYLKPSLKPIGRPKKRVPNPNPVSLNRVFQKSKVFFEKVGTKFCKCSKSQPKVKF
jgi:hypothetical protein